MFWQFRISACLDQNNILFYNNILSHFFLYVPVVGQSPCLSILAIGYYITAVLTGLLMFIHYNSILCFLYQVIFLILLGKCSGMLGHTLVLFYFWGSFIIVCTIFASSHMYQGSNLSTFTLILILFLYSPLNGSEVVLWIWLVFVQCQWCWVLCNTSSSRNFISFTKTFIKVFENQMVGTLLIESSHYIWEISLTNMCKIILYIKYISFM